MMLHSFRTKRLSCVVALLLAASLVAGQSSAPEFPDPGRPHMSRDEQRQLGLQAAGQVYQQMPVLPDNSPETQYIRKLGQKLVATIPPEYSWPFEFHVAAQKDINAFALPGGPMFVNVGTITAAQNEAEHAGVMAHEMSHVIMQHSAKQADKAQTTSLWAGLASLAAGAVLGGGMAAQAAQAGISMTAQGMSLKYSRTDESQADAVGAVILYKAGYNPQALADFFRALETEGGAAPPQWLSDHPNPGNRELAIQKEIRNWPPENYNNDNAAFLKAKAHAVNVKAYTGEEIAAGAKTGQWAALNKKNGATFNAGNAQMANTSAPAPAGPASSAPAPAEPASSVPLAAAPALPNVVPNPRMVATDLGPIKISRPENWDVTMPKQQGDFLTIAPPAGVTENGVGYGLLINAAGTSGQRISIDDATAQIIQHLQKTQGLQPLGQHQAISVDGIQGRSVVLQSQSPFAGANGQPQQERDWLITLPESQGSILMFVFVAPQAEYDRFHSTFESMLKSVKF